jgi:hypothetical protein
MRIFFFSLKCVALVYTQRSKIVHLWLNPMFKIWWKIKNLIKSYIKSTMSKERLNGLAIWSVENEC